MSAEKTAPQRKASAPELISAIALLIAALVLTGSVLHWRMSAAPKGSSPSSGEADPLKGTIIVPEVAEEGLSYSKGPDLLFVDSTPAGAEVVMDGQSLGPAPYSTNLVCGSGPRKVEVKKSGFLTLTYAVECGKGTARVSATLKKK